jgi:small subunit ribosomal protein S15
MPLANEAKQTVIREYQKHESDVGSSEVQVAILSRRISDLTEHLKTHNKDFSSRRGLLAMVSRRRSLLTYLKKGDPQSYRTLVQSLELRG